jgi:hypothetical protein
MTNPRTYAPWSRQASLRICFGGDCFYSNAEDGSHEPGFEDTAVCMWCGEGVVGGREDKPTASDRRARAAEAICGCPCGHDDGGSCLTCAWVHRQAEEAP